MRLIDQGYSVNVGFRGNKEYNNDKNSDGELDATSFGVSTYGHSVRMCAHETDKTLLNVIVDNYVKSGTKKNIYKIKRANLSALVLHRVFYETGYVFAIKEDQEMVKPLDVPVWGLKTVDKALAKKIIKDTQNLEIMVGTSVNEDILIGLGGLTKKEGSVSLLRLLVAYDRLGLLN